MGFVVRALQILSMDSHAAGVMSPTTCCREQDLVSLLRDTILVLWYLVALYLNLIRLTIHFPFKHLSVLPGNALYVSCAVQFHLPSVLDCHVCYKLDRG